MKSKKRIKRIRREYCYKTSDNKTFTGPKAKDKAKSHERSIIFRESKNIIYSEARKLFDIPLLKPDNHSDGDDRDQREIDFMEELMNIVYRDRDFYYIDDFVELIMDLVELNPRAMESLIALIKDQKREADKIEDAILL